MGTPLNFQFTQFCLDLWKLWPSKIGGLPVKKNFTKTTTPTSQKKLTLQKTSKNICSCMYKVTKQNYIEHQVFCHGNLIQFSLTIENVVWFLGYRRTMMGFRMFRVTQYLNKVGNRHQRVPLFSYYHNGFLLMLLLHSVEELYTCLPIAILPRSN
jgi:hypothetical protein